MQRLLICLCFLFAIVLPCHAQGDKVKPNTLTPKEIADGWILLFDGETTFGWQIFPGAERAANVDDGALSFGPISFGKIKSTTKFQDFDMSFEYYLESGVAHVGVEDTALSKPTYGIVFPLNKHGAWTQYQFRVSNKLIYVEGTKDAKGEKRMHEWQENSIFHFGSAKLAKNLKLRNIKLRPLNTTSLFNGKDLAGWKTFPGDKYKSKFSVNDKGELNVKDGPGDLQTGGKYKDFILQLECISNGKHLNSGIFFRCRDGEYQNGYEAQIRNQFTKDAAQKYLIEEYDPKTNKLVGKKEILSTAFDFGTGAIYRRVPARKEMSKDGEWFSMTIAAQGNHFATWVNGVQVTDWFDNRPKSDNARTGCKLEAGHLSIQGHDPTTDLSFRNLRIAEMK